MGRWYEHVAAETGIGEYARCCLEGVPLEDLFA
jgi:hypothetical protein